MQGVNGGSVSRSDIVGEGRILITASMDPQAKKAITDFLGSLNQIVKGDKLAQYFDNLSNVTSKFSASLARFKKDESNFDFAKSLVNNFNALEGIANADGKKLEDVLKGVAGGYDKIIEAVERAQSVAKSTSFDGITAKSVQDFVESGRIVESWGADVKRVIGQVVKNSSTEELQRQITELNDALAASSTERDKAIASIEGYKKATEEAEESARRQRELYNETFFGDDYQQLTEKAEKYDQVVQQNIETVRRFIEISQLGTFDTFGGLNSSVDFYGIQTILNRVESGSINANEAIVQLKESYGQLIDLSNAESVGEDKIRNLETAVSETASMVRELKEAIGTSGFNGSSGNTILDRAVGSSEEIRGDAEALQAAKEVVVGLLNSLAGGEDEAAAGQSAISSLVSTLKELASVDVQGLTLTSDILRRLPNIANVQVDTKQIDNLLKALKDLSQLAKDINITNLTPLTNVNLSGFSNLTISKASMSNLATYLPIITSGSVDIDKLRALSQISLANFNQDNLKVSKASFEHLRELIQTIQGAGNGSDAFAHYDYGAGQTALEDQVERVTQAVKNEKAAFAEGNQAKKEDAAAAEAAAKAEEEKAKISALLAATLKQEQAATDSTSNSAKKHTDVIKEQEDAMWAAYNAEKEREAQIDSSISRHNAAEDAKTAAAEAAIEARTRKEIQAYEEAEAKEQQRLQRLAAAEADYYAKQEQARADAEAKKQAQIDAEIAKHNAALEKEEAAVEAATRREVAAWEQAEEKKIAAVEKAAAKAAAAEQKAAEASAKRDTYDDAKRSVNRYWGLLTSKDTNEAKRQDVVMTEMGWSSQSGKYAELAQQLNDATTAYNMFTDAQNKSQMSGQQVAAVQELNAQRQKDYNLAVENSAAKEAEAAAKKQAAADASRSAAEAKKQEAEALNAQAQAERERVSAIKDAQRQESERASTLNGLNNLIVRCTDAQRKFAAAQNVSSMKDSYSDLNRISVELRKVKEELDSGSISVSEAKERWRQLGVQFNEVNTRLKTTGSFIGRYLTTGMQQLKSRLTYSLGLAAMVYKAVNEIKKMISTAVELDSAMNTLQIVTRASGAEMEEYGRRVSAMAKETAQATKDLIDATTVFARLGYSMDESSALAKYTAMLQGVGDIDASAAQDAMTAIIKAFGKNVDDIEDVMDKLVKVGNNFPISVSQLAEGMNNASSMLAVAGNSFEQSVALLTAANTTIQNVSKASTGLRTIAARIRKTTTGEEDGEIVEEAKYQEMLNALTRQHVSLVDEATGEYRSTYDVIKDIAGVWDDLTSMEQAAVIEALAGTRQQNIFTSLVTQFQEAENAYEAMGNASGELQESYDIYLNSIQAHVQQMKAAYDELARDFVNSDLAKGAVDLLTKIIEGLDALVKALGGVGTAFTIIGVPLIIHNFEALSGIITKVFTAITSKGVNGLLVMSNAANALDVKLTAITAKLSALAPILVPVVALLGAAAVAYKITEGHNLETATKDANELKNEIDSLNKELETNADRIKELNEQKAHGDFTVQQETELNLLKAQNDALGTQIKLLEEKYKKSKQHEHDVAVETANGLLGNNQNRYSTKDAINTYLEAQERLAKKDTATTRKMYNAANDVLQGQLTSYNNILSVLDLEEDAELIAQIKDDIDEITSAISGIPMDVIHARRELEELQKGGAVDLLNRPVVDTNVLRAAGWNEAYGDGATVYTATYSDKDETVAVNFTPILTDKDGNFIGVLSPDELQQYAEGVIAGATTDKYNLQIGARFEGDDAIERADEAADRIHELHELVYGEDLKKIQKFHTDVKKLSKGTFEALKKYVTDGERLTDEQERELAEFLSTSEYSAEEFARLFTQMTASASEGVEAQVRSSISDLTSFRDELAQTSKALEEYNKALEGGEKGDAYASMAEIYKGAMEDIASGKYDTNRLRAAANLFFTPQQLAEMDFNMMEVGKRLRSSMLNELFDPQDTSNLTAGQRLMKYIQNNAKQFEGVAEVLDIGGGRVQFWYESIEQLANAFGISEEALAAFLDEWDAYGIEVIRSNEENKELIGQFLEMQNELGSTKDAVRRLIEQMHASGNDQFQISSILQDMRADGYIGMGVQELNNLIATTIDELNRTDETDAEPTVTANTSQAMSALQTVLNYLNTINGYNAVATVSVGSGSTASSTTGGNGASGTFAGEAAGGKAPGGGGGKTLVNELGPELISDEGRAYIANGGKPGFVDLSKDAIVFTADETEDILHGKKTVNAKARAEGTGRAGLIGRLLGRGTHAMADSSKWTCLHCGTQNAQTTVYCRNCGKVRGTSPAPTTPTTPPVTTGPTIPQIPVIPTGGSGGGYSSQSAAEPQKIDWIAVRLSRIQRVIQDLEKVASSGFKRLTTRLDASKDEVVKLKEEIVNQQQGYYRYIQEAGRVGLSDDLAQLVREGDIDIEKYDDDTRKKIQEYQEWYEKALACESAIEDLHQSIAQLYQTAFDNTQTDFENRIAEIEHTANMAQKNMDMASAKGYLDSAKFYEQLADIEVENINMLRAELAALNLSFQEAMDSGEIETESEAWYAMRQSIQDVEEAIADANIQLVEYQRTIRSINWSYFDYAQERFSQLTSEAEFLVNLMSNHNLFEDNGQFNELGAATAGLHAVNYDVYMAQADEYAKEIQKINRELENDPADTALIERRETLLGLQQQSILSAEAEKNAVKDLVQNGINLELEALKKLIDAYNDSIDSAKDLYEYQKKVTEQTANIATIEKQLSAYAGDTSEETRAKLQKLNKDLKDAQTALSETERDQSISDQKKLLDDLYDEYEGLLNARLDNIDLLMQEIIAGTNENMDDIRNTLIEVGDEVGYTLTDQMQQAMQGDLGYYDHMFDGINSIQVVLENIYQMVGAMAEASGAVKAYASGGLVDYTGLAAVHGTSQRPELMLNAGDTENFLEAARMMRSMFTSSTSSPLSVGTGGGGGLSIGQFQVNIPIERVQNYNDFVAQLRDDPKFERLIGAMTLDRVAGKSGFEKNRIRF